MADKPVLYGFDGSTYVRTVRMVMADKGVDYDQAPINVLEGGPREPDHLARHPFGKVPVLDIDGRRIRETDAICRYLEDTRPRPALIPDAPGDRARMNEGISLIGSYGYGALVGGVAYHLFPDFIGGKDDAAHDAAVREGMKLLKLLIENKGSSKWLAGDKATLADYFLAPLLFYVSLTPDADKVLGVSGVQPLWEAMQGLESFKSTEPDLE